MSIEALFDLADIEEKPVYAGPAPLGFTSAYFLPDELLAGREELARLRGAWSKDHPTAGAWALAVTTGWCNEAPGHRLCMLWTDLRCHCRFPYLVAEWEEIGPCFCVGDLLYQANCPDCRWHSIHADEGAAVEAWCDHAWPGWRDLPVVPLSERPYGGGFADKGAKRGREWVEKHYPAEWQVDGAPVRTERQRMGTRHVPGYSPWGGFDMCARVADTEAVAA